MCPLLWSTQRTVELRPAPEVAEFSESGRWPYLNVTGWCCKRKTQFLSNKFEDVTKWKRVPAWYGSQEQKSLLEIFESSPHALPCHSFKHFVLPSGEVDIVLGCNSEVKSSKLVNDYYIEEHIFRWNSIFSSFSKSERSAFCQPLVTPQWLNKYTSGNMRRLPQKSSHQCP